MSQSWIPRKDLKVSNPMEMEELAISRGPAFTWWVPSVIKKRRQIISKRKTNKTQAKLTKFGITIPKHMKETKVLDAENVNNLLGKAEENNLENKRIAFELLEEDSPVPVGSK